MSVWLEHLAVNEFLTCLWSNVTCEWKFFL